MTAKVWNTTHTKADAGKKIDASLQQMVLNYLDEKGIVFEVYIPFISQASKDVQEKKTLKEIGKKSSRTPPQISLQIVEDSTSLSDSMCHERVPAKGS